MESPIEVLSDDVLLEVFEFLDANSLKKAALVCKNWNDVIGLSPSTMKKLRLKISNIAFSSQNKSWEEKVEEVLSLERKFQAIDVTLFDLRTENAAASFVNIMAWHGSQIREMVIRDVNFGSFDEFSKVLENVPLLEKLEVTHLKFKTIGKEGEMKSTALKKLQSLTVQRSNWSVFQMLIGSQITSLTVAKTIIDPAEAIYFINFLKASEKLESIEIDFFGFIKIFHFPIPEKINFKLKKVHYTTVQMNFHETETNFNNFLLSQSSSIEELIFNLIPQKVVKTIISKIPNLRKLRIHSRSIPTEKEFYDHVKPMKNLKEIEAHDEFLHEDALKNFLGLCPNLENFKAIHDEGGIVSSCLPFISLYNPKMKILTIDKLRPQEDSEIKFKNLKVLHIENIDNAENLLNFLKENQSVEKLSVGNSDRIKISDDFLETLMNETKLLHLKFAGDYDSIEGIYNKIKTNYKNLRSLELTELLFVTKGKTLTFNFPADKTLWNSKCDFFD